MCAMVARTVSISRFSCWIPAAGCQAARVTHTLLLLAAQILVLTPGVCDACVKGCCAGGTARIADVASPIVPPVCGSSDPAGGCKTGHCCRVTATDDRAADSCHEGVTVDCRCQFEPREVPPAAASLGQSDRRGSTPRWDDREEAGTVTWLPSATGHCDGRQLIPGAVPGRGTAIPSRPVRVLYGVWRN